MDLSLILTLLTSALALYIGSRIKASEASNKWIPWVTLAISFLNQLAQAIGGVTPAHAAVLADSVAAVAPVVQHGFFHSVFFKILVNAVFQAIGVTGVVSFAKNGILGKVSESRSYTH